MTIEELVSGMGQQFVSVFPTQDWSRKATVHDVMLMLTVQTSHLKTVVQKMMAKETTEPVKAVEKKAAEVKVAEVPKPKDVA